MNNWCVAGQMVDQASLAGQLGSWLARVPAGVYVFREGPAISRFDWGDQRWICEAELDRLWTVRMFCRKFELYARRLDNEQPAQWQLRIAAGRRHAVAISGGQDLRPVARERVLLLGRSTGEAAPDHCTRFVLKPNRYQLARLSYPGCWRPGERGVLMARRFQPAAGGDIVCWLGLWPVRDAQLENSATR